MSEDPKAKIVIIGAGVFGLSTAWYLLKRGYTDILVLERCTELPAHDGAGYDMNKGRLSSANGDLVRSSYSEPFYTNLAREAIALWKDEKGELGLQGLYHESGVLILRTEQNAAYSDNAYENDVASGARIQKVEGRQDLEGIVPGETTDNGGDELRGYLNLDGGWAEAARGLDAMLANVQKLGARVEGGKEVTGLLKDEEGKTCGVQCTDGSSFPADIVVLAAGAWAPALAERAGVQGMNTKFTATGQTVVWFELTPQEAERYKRAPVVLDFGTGFYMFPPNAENVVKMGIHSNGYLCASSDSSTTSAPRTAVTHGADGLRIPKEAVKAFRESLRSVYPELGEKPFQGTRLCWYNDTPDDDWIIGYHPLDTGLLLATAGSGHAYKFLPNIGALVVDALEHKLAPEVAARLAVNRDVNVQPISRVGPPAKNLVLDELCDAQDLLA